MGFVKKTFLGIFLTLILVTGLSAQSFVWHVDSTVSYALPGQPVSFHTFIHNISGTDLSVNIIRQANQIPVGWFSSFCVGSSCYSPFQDTVQITIPAGDVDTLLVDINTDANPDVGTVTVKVENQANPSEFQMRDFVVSTGPNSIGSADYPVTGGFQLYPNFPNPFNPSTTIPFEIGSGIQGNVSLMIYNLLGQRVKVLLNRPVSPGVYRVRWNGRDDFGKKVPSGIYFYRLQAGKYTRLGKMVYTR